MNKRLEKRHKRQVSRAKERVKLSEPDVRTPEEIRAARDASGTAAHRRSGPDAHYAAPSTTNRAGATGHSAAKADA